VFTWHGASLSIAGNFIVDYTSSETPMISYYNTHLALEQVRRRALEQPEPTFVEPLVLRSPPRVLIMGSSRNTVSRILTNYSVRQERTPIFVDGDISNGEMLFPGTLSCCKMDRIIDVIEGFPLSNPLAYFFGHLTIGNNLSLYKKLISRLSDMVDKKMTTDKSCFESGLFFNFPEWSDVYGLELLKHVVESFKINVVLVVGNERLASEITKKVNILTLKLPKSGGVIIIEVHNQGCNLRFNVSSKISDA
jgi:polyribonucleotide 5'-hydroxyl-kinase